MNKNLKVVFMGTPNFSLAALKKLIQANNIDVLAVFSQADKAVGRGKKITQTPTKVLALEHKIAVFQPEKLKLELENIKQLAPDIIIVIAYGKIIPQSILDIPRFGCLNIHASLLPKYRGSSCLQAPILNGDTETGVTIMKLDANMDTGPILNQKSITLNGTETAETLHDKLSEMGAELLMKTIYDYCEGKIKAKAQDNDKASYVSLIKKENGKLDPNLDAQILERQIRAFYPWPGTYLELSNGEKLKILSAKISKKYTENKIGSFFTEKNELFLRCGQNNLHILKLQRENRKALNAAEFLKGNKDILHLIAI